MYLAPVLKVCHLVGANIAPACGRSGEKEWKLQQRGTGHSTLEGMVSFRSLPEGLLPRCTEVLCLAYVHTLLCDPAPTTSCIEAPFEQPRKPRGESIIQRCRRRSNRTPPWILLSHVNTKPSQQCVHTAYHSGLKHNQFVISRPAC